MRRSKWLLASLACAIPCFSQWLDTTYDGSAVWMASPWYQRGDKPGTGESFIYRLEGPEWSLAVRSGTGGRILAPSVSADGKVLSWSRSPICPRCFFPLPSTEFSGIDREIAISRQGLALSRNARWAVSPGWPQLADFALQDLQTGRVWKTPDAPKLVFLTRPIGVGDDGSVVGLLDNALVHWRPGADPPRRLFAGDSRIPFEWGISSDGRRAWASFGKYDQREELVWLDLESGTRAVVSARAPDRVRSSADGSRLLLASPFTSDGRNLTMWDSASRQSRLVLEGAEGRINDFALSGDGRIVWVQMEPSWQLLRVEINTGRVETRLEGLPFSIWPFGAGVPGSALEFSLNGGGVSEDFEARIGVDGGNESLPVVSRSLGSIVLQVPWDLQAPPPLSTPDGYSSSNSIYQVSMWRNGNPFELRGTAYVMLNGIWPRLALANPRSDTDDRLLKAAHQDFGSLISRDNPAKPGETIHTWMVGLGPLDRIVPTGAPGPNDPPARPVAGLACYLLGPANEPPASGLRVPFAAYAPGLVGFYQVDVTIPESWPDGTHTLRCESGGNSTEAELPVRY